MGSASIAFQETNGTFNFTVQPILGYTASEATGSVILDGTASSVSIRFISTSLPVGRPKRSLVLGLGDRDRSVGPDRAHAAPQSRDATPGPLEESGLREDAPSFRPDPSDGPGPSVWSETAREFAVTPPCGRTHPRLFFRRWGKAPRVAINSNGASAPLRAAGELSGGPERSEATPDLPTLALGCAERRGC